MSSEQGNPIVVQQPEEADLGGGDHITLPGEAGFLPGDVLVKHTAGADLVCQLMWEFAEGTQPVDLDCSAICFDETGTIMDAAYYNCLSAVGGCIKHSGDSRDGATEGVDEQVSVDLDDLPINAKVIVFVINAHSGGTLESVESANAQFLDVTDAATPGSNVGSIFVGAGDKHTAMIMGAIYRHSPNKKWYLRTIAQPAMGFNFNDCLIPIRAIVDTMLDEGMKYERVLTAEKAFDMKKGDFALLPPEIKSVAVGLGWTVSGRLDLDGSVILLKGSAPELVHVATVMYSKTVYNNANGVTCVKHSGDNLTGAGDGDDETINILLDEVPEEISSMVFVVNVFTMNGSFAQCSDSYVALRADTDGDATDGHILAKFEINGDIKCSGLIFARLVRVGTSSGRRWAFETMGEGSWGRSAVDREVLNVVLKKTPGIDIPRNSGAKAANIKRSSGEVKSCCTLS